MHASNLAVSLFCSLVLIATNREQSNAAIIGCYVLAAAAAINLYMGLPH